MPVFLTERTERALKLSMTFASNALGFEMIQLWLESDDQHKGEAHDGLYHCIFAYEDDYILTHFNEHTINKQISSASKVR